MVLRNKTKSCKPDKGGYITQGYIRRSVDGVKVLEHRMVWEDNFGLIPEGKCIHHKDSNKLNNKLENLELVTPKEHSRYHRKFDYEVVKKLREEGNTLQKIADIIGTKSTGTVHMILEAQK